MRRAISWPAKLAAHPYGQADLECSLQPLEADAERWKSSAYAARAPQLFRQRLCMRSSMKAVVLSAPGPVENLQIRELSIPESQPGWVRIKVEAFGLNRSELHTRLGLAEGVTFPRVLGIECVGVVDAVPGGGDLGLGQQVAAMMGGMGRTF